MQFNNNYTYRLSSSISKFSKTNRRDENKSVIKLERFEREIIPGLYVVSSNSNVDFSRISERWNFLDFRGVFRESKSEFRALMDYLFVINELVDIITDWN